MPESTVAIELDQAERHILADLLRPSVCKRAVRAIKAARYSMDLEEVSERVRRLALVKGLAEGAGLLPRADLEAVRGDLALWAAEAARTVDAHEALLDGVRIDSREATRVRELIAVSYAHRCVCEQIVAQIEAVREGVALIAPGARPARGSLRLV